MNKAMFQFTVQTVVLICIFSPLVFIFNFGILLGLAWAVIFDVTTLAAMTFLLRNNDFLNGRERNE